MSTTVNLDQMLEFEGPVECEPGSGAVILTLRGRERGRADVTALFAGAAGSSGLTGLPARLHDVRLLGGAAASGVHQVRLQSPELQQDLVFRSLQLHRDAGRPFFGAVPPVAVPVARRLRWAVLLWVLRIPGAAGLLAALRGNR